MPYLQQEGLAVALCLMSHTLGMKYQGLKNNNNNNIRLISQDKPLDHNTSYIDTSVTQDSYLGLCCHAGQPMVIGQRWAAAGSGPVNTCNS